MKQGFKLDLPKKPTYLKIAEDVDFFDLFCKIEAKYDNCYLLESMGEESSERHSVIGFDPKYVFDLQPDFLDILEQNKTIHSIPTSNAYQELSKLIPQNIISKKYAGGLFGYLSYESINFFESKLSLPVHKDFGLGLFGLYLDGLVLDKMSGEVFYFYYLQDRSNTIKDFINSASSELKNFKATFEGYSIKKDEHFKRIDRSMEEIKKGNSFQIQVGFKANYTIQGNPLDVYQKLSVLNPSPFMYYIKFSDKKLVGASPELLFSLQEGYMQTSPLAGTIKRGASSREDIQLARELLNDKKEIAEHNMLVDMHRNDIGRVAKFGTVRVSKLIEIKRFSHVQHISSDVVGIIDKDQDMFTALASNFPAGTLCGSPKLETVKIIDSLEKDPRGPYGGAVGYFGLNGNCKFCIPIRSFFVNNNQGFAQASSGIVYDSDKEKEYQEVVNKLKAMEIVLGSSD